ncbi:hypothetical protein ABT369_38900 [Dactylosporangium sp. NPDC000244]|uniref:hypothetical protein n=1 Tax=Dactylosporangium sp. NPDC000244 TaxID=3154365 RepID=UPI003318AD4B
MADGNELGPLVQIGDIICNSDGLDSAGVAWLCEEFEGWGSPGSTLEVVQRSGDHGGWDGDAFLKPRIVSLKGMLAAPTAAAAQDALSRLNQAVSLALSPLTVTEAGLARTCMVRRQDDVLASAVSAREYEWSAQVVAPDPRKYTAWSAAVTGLPSSTGGLTWPVTWPVVWAATVTTGVLSVVNAGDIGSRPVLRIDGPCQRPRVALVGTGQVLAWDLTLDVGQWLDVDTDRHTSLLNGQVSRSGMMTSRGWFEITGAQEIQFTADVYDPAALLTVTYRSAWQ